MASIKLNKSEVDHLKVEKTAYTVWDTEVRGFGVRVWSSGSKVYVFKYQHRGKQHWITLGPANQLPFARAKKKATELRLEILDGQNPGQEIQERRDALTVSALCERFIAEHVDVKTKASTQKEYRRVIEHDIRPSLGEMKVEDVKPKDVHELHHKLSASPIQANRTMAVLSKMFTLSELWGIRPQNSNPCHLIQKMPENRRERFLSEKELKAIGTAISALEETLEIPIFAGAAIRMLILTGARLGEITGLRWEMVDTENGFLHLPDSKTGKKVIFLNLPAIELFDELPRLMTNPHVFPGEIGNGPITNLIYSWNRVKKKSGISGVRIHDLRHTFASMAARSGLSLQIVGALLGHAHPSTTKRYTHFASKPLQDGSQQVGNMLGLLLGVTSENIPDDDLK